MQVEFNKPVTIGKNTYTKGQHEVPESDAKDNWFFDALVKEGSAVVLQDEEAVVLQDENVAQEQTEKPSKNKR